jgi:hypothetical protein
MTMMMSRTMKRRRRGKYMEKYEGSRPQ